MRAKLARPVEPMLASIISEAKAIPTVVCAVAASHDTAAVVGDALVGVTVAVVQATIVWRMTEVPETSKAGTRKCRVLDRIIDPQQAE